MFSPSNPDKFKNSKNIARLEKVSRSEEFGVRKHPVFISDQNLRLNFTHLTTALDYLCCTNCYISVCNVFSKVQKINSKCKLVIFIFSERVKKEK